MAFIESNPDYVAIVVQTVPTSLVTVENINYFKRLYNKNAYLKIYEN
jgi:hypothetical protein